jgi:4-hydroxy-2-oxoheptanedioate aldolase
MKSQIKKQIKSRRVLGTWSMLGSSMAAEVVASTGLDFVIIDLEHGVFDFSETADIVRAIQGANCAALIRTSSSDEHHILRCLECRPDGILVPHISSVEQARAVVNSCYYKPQGTRGLSPYTRVHSFTHENLSESMKTCNDNLFVGLLVEGQKGIEAAAEIAKIEGLDLLYFGIYDFTASLGFGDKIDHPDVQLALKKMVEACAQSGVSTGTFVRSLESAQTLEKAGLRFIAFGSDGLLLKQGFSDVVKRLL